MSQSSDKAEIEIEDAEDDNEIKSKAKAAKHDRLTITRKKVSELSDAERNQLIKDAQNGIENDFFDVRLCKNGSTRICLKKQSTAQRVINEAKESNPTAVPTVSRKYYTDNQLLMEHIINLESSFNSLRAKHKKLKKRYNELEGYLYADEQPLKDDVLKDVKPDNDEPVEPPKQPTKQQLEQPLNNEVDPEDQPILQQPIKRRFVRSWRDLNNQ